MSFFGEIVPLVLTLAIGLFVAVVWWPHPFAYLYGGIVLVMTLPLCFQLYQDNKKEEKGCSEQ